MLKEQFDYSERAACKLLGVDRDRVTGTRRDPLTMKSCARI